MAQAPPLPYPGESPTWGQSAPPIISQFLNPLPPVSPIDPWHPNPEPVTKGFSSPLIVPPPVVEKQTTDIFHIAGSGLPEVFDDDGLKIPPLPTKTLFPKPVVNKAASEPQFNTVADAPVKGKLYKVRISIPSKPEKLLGLKGRSISVLGFKTAVVDTGYMPKGSNEMFVTLQFGGS